ncbi:hypothetical protein D5F01_LYC05730 [Larimichthys crocea]|uniref:Immunoglobulin domain-containing protein n=1 Tax=Larimichthys crocea TaxID=215358 RepID=A0A6G0IU55_LARCR|nr:hypothetical protein D5F01_LYC05730 [Larimichthys crocea]
MLLDFKDFSEAVLVSLNIPPRIKHCRTHSCSFSLAVSGTDPEARHRPRTCLDDMTRLDPPGNESKHLTCYDWGESREGSVLEGEVGWLSCPLFSHPSVYNYTSSQSAGHNLFWYHLPDGHDLEQPIKYSSRISKDRERLWLQPAAGADTGLYICMLRKISMRLRVLRPDEVARGYDCEPPVAMAPTHLNIGRSRGGARLPGLPGRRQDGRQRADCHLATHSKSVNKLPTIFHPAEEQIYTVKQGETRTDQNGPGETRTDQNGPGETRTDQNGPGETRTDQNGPGETRTDQNGPGWLKLDSFKHHFSGVVFPNPAGWAGVDLITGGRGLARSTPLSIKRSGIWSRLLSAVASCQAAAFISCQQPPTAG